ncbi:hypothetical protein [Ferruginibacter sp.]
MKFPSITDDQFQFENWKIASKNIFDNPKHGIYVISNNKELVGKKFNWDDSIIHIGMSHSGQYGIYARVKIFCKLTYKKKYESAVRIESRTKLKKNLTQSDFCFAFCEIRNKNKSITPKEYYSHLELDALYTFKKRNKFFPVFNIALTKSK